MSFILQEQKHWSLTAFQLRENPLIDSEIVTWTVLQRIQLIQRERASLPNSSARSLAEHFSSVEMAKSSESLSPAFIDAACTVHARLLSLPGVMTILESWDDKAGLQSPFNSIWKLETIIHKCKTSEKIAWTLKCIADAMAMGFIEPCALSNSSIRTTWVRIEWIQSLMPEVEGVSNAIADSDSAHVGGLVGWVGRWVVVLNRWWWVVGVCG